MNRRCCLPAASSVRYTTSCKRSLVLLKMVEIIARNMLSWLELLINRYCCRWLVVYIIEIGFLQHIIVFLFPFSIPDFILYVSLSNFLSIHNLDAKSDHIRRFCRDVFGLIMLSLTYIASINSVPSHRLKFLSYSGSRSINLSVVANVT